MTETVDLIICDDHAVFRQGLARLLRRLEFLGKIYEAADGRELIDKLEKLRPGLVLLDIEMPRMNGIQVMENIRQLPSHPRVIVLSMYCRAEYVKKLYQLGISAYLLKETEFPEVELAMREVMAGRVFYSELLKERLFRDQGQGQEAVLNEKEKEILRLICMQLSGREIAEELNISEETVSRYKNLILEKTKAKNTAGMVVYAVQQGIFTI